MNFTLKDENFFKNNGYLIKKTTNNKSLNYLKELVFKSLLDSKKKLNKKNFKNKHLLFENFHKYFNRYE